MSVDSASLEAQEAWLAERRLAEQDEWFVKHGDPDRPGYHLLHPGVSRPRFRRPESQRGRGVGVPKPNADGIYPPMSAEQRAARRVDVEAKMAALIKANASTEHLYSKDGGQVWSPERAAEHERLLAELEAKYQRVPTERRLLMFGGLGGAGKSTSYTTKDANGNKVITEAGKAMGITLDDKGEVVSHVVINADDFKELLARDGLIPNPPGVSPMEAAALVHEESSYLAKAFLKRMLAQGKNVLYDATMAAPKSNNPEEASAIKVLRQARAAGYTTTGAFVSVRVATSLARVEERWARGQTDYNNGRGYGGRLVPSGIIRANADPSGTWRSRNEMVYAALAQRRDLFDNALPIFDNEVPFGMPPKVIPFGERPEL